MRSETEESGETAKVAIGIRRTKKLIEYLNKLSNEKHNGILKFDFAGSKERLRRISPKDNTKTKRLHDGVGIAIEFKYADKTYYIHPRATQTVEELAGATLTTESNRTSEWGLLSGSLIMSTIVDRNDVPLKYAIFKFDDLLKIGCVEHRRDRNTNVRVYLHKVAESLTLFYGGSCATGLLFQNPRLDAVASILEIVKQK